MIPCALEQQTCAGAQALIAVGINSAVGYNFFCALLCLLQLRHIRNHIRNLHLREPMLALAEKITRTAQAQVSVGNLKTIRRTAKDLQPGGGFLIPGVGK